MPATPDSKTREKLLATTLASIGDGVIATDTQGRVTLLNPEAERLTGWANADALGRPLSEVFRIVNEQSRATTENPVETVLRLGKTVGLANHTVLIGKNGKETPIDDSAAPIRNDDGSLAGVVLIFRDFTEARKAQQDRARLAAIVEHSGDAILTKNLSGIIQSWNAGAERLFGYRAEEVVGKSVTILFPPDRLKEEDHILGMLRQGKPCLRLETIRLTKDRRPLNVSVSISPLKDNEGTVVGASKIIHDTTESVQAHEALEREKELFATTLASIGDAVITTDEKGHVTFLNAEAERMTGWRNAEAQNQSLPQVFKIINEESRQPVENPVDKVLRYGHVVGLANHTLLIARDGSECPIDDSAAPIREPNGPLFGVVLVFRDFTERRQAEQSLRHAQQQLQEHASRLEATVAERTVRLTEMISELQQVSYSITHDMRAPVRAMGRSSFRWGIWGL